MSQIIGRIVADATSKEVKESNVVSFRVAVNTSYFSKDKGENIENVDYFEAEYWTKSTKVVESLTKGKLVVIDGRITASAYVPLENDQPKVDASGKIEAKATLRIRVENIQF